MLNRLKNWFRNLPDKKKYLELITAFLTIPVLLTVLLTNLSRIQDDKKNAMQNTPTLSVPTKEIVIREVITTTPVPTSEEEKPCIPQIGPVSIQNPTENSIVSDNPFSIIMSYTDGSYCPVVWSYRINNSSWSTYTDKSIDIYNVDRGEKKLEVRIRSTVSKEEKILVQNFTYDPPENKVVTPATTQTPVPMPSLVISPLPTL